MSGEPRKLPGWVNPVATLAVVFGLLAAVSFLPPDTSLSEVQRIGILRVCVPADQAPLITTDADKPGFEVELLRELAADLGVQLAFNVNSSIGRDINPRNWRLNRAQCQMIAGGVVATATTRSYLDTTPPHLETGMAIIEPQPVATLEGTKTGFLAGFSGFDRIAISRWLRGQKADIDVINSREEMVSSLKSGDITVGVTEALGANSIAEENGWSVSWLSSELEHYPIAFGLWKGDLTLKRAIVAAMHRLDENGRLDALFDRYALGTIDKTFGETAGG
jgi:polar amino acid transport system substrate-binding protein/cystine transport system substrate-binding protein/membrane-bound lytic murein transglycosylase F